MDYSSDEVQLNKKTSPNVLVTGTPGTGKTSTCELVADMMKLKHVNVGKLVEEEQLFEGMDPVFGSMIIDEERLLDRLEDILAFGGCVVDHHGCDLFPERWFDAVIVLTCDNTLLYDRLQERGYTQQKVEENVECEIMNVIVQEARDSYKENIVHVMESETTEQMQQNAKNICSIYEKAKKENYNK